MTETNLNLITILIVSITIEDREHIRQINTPLRSGQSSLGILAEQAR